MSIDINGFEFHKNFVKRSIVDDVIEELEKFAKTMPKTGVRNADKKLAQISQLVYSDYFISQAQTYFMGTPKVVRVIVFDKTPNSNWLVSWHQDKTVAVSNNVAIDGWGPWTIKDQVHHVQPELTVLKNMVTFRLHLDDSDQQNGCLKVIPGSHNLGIIKQTALAELSKQAEPVFCQLKAGDLMVMRPLLVHSSSKASKPKHRRVIHIEYSDYPLPKGLSWA